MGAEKPLLLQSRVIHKVMKKLYAFNTFEDH